MAQVNVSHVVRAAAADPPAPQGAALFPEDVRPVEEALADKGLLDRAYVDGSFGTLTLGAYRRLQQSYGYSGADADGVPGATSLTRLGHESGLFSVVDGDNGPPSRGIGLSDVVFDRVPDGSTSVAIQQVCQHMDVPLTWWLPGYMTIASRESGYDFDAVNSNDRNAHGPIQSDGYPLYCSRGVVQCIPPTFAHFHESGTANHIYDGVANIAASMNYVMDTYGVARDGHNLAAKVQQADPHRPPFPY
ncbi:hypothetical protein AB0K51_20385 [Kitasatospora sp. NPDC049285]|uniref:hypothetical protein n=1 Tax=Kitasatospora sp. NPDC049285 TaxID=3157096 RepID=UPI00341C230E